MQGKAVREKRRVCPMLVVSVRSIVKTMDRDTKKKTNTRAQLEEKYLESNVRSLWS